MDEAIVSRFKIKLFLTIEKQRNCCLRTVNYYYLGNKNGLFKLLLSTEGENIFLLD